MTMSTLYPRCFWTGSLVAVCLVFSSLPAPAQTSASHSKSATSKVAKKRDRTRPATEANLPSGNDMSDLPLGVQDNLAEAKRLQEQYRREEAARRRAEAEARKQGLPWPPPEETNTEKLDTPPTVPSTVSQPAPPPEAETPPPPVAPPVEQQLTTPPSESQSRNSTPITPPTPPALPADGRTIIRTWPQVKKPTKPSLPQ